jgi:hypothetical protein
MRDDQIPFLRRAMEFAVHCLEARVFVIQVENIKAERFPATIDYFQHIILNMPLRMPAAALLYVARESPMPTLTERLAYFLAFFASY